MQNRSHKVVDILQTIGRKSCLTTVNYIKQSLNLSSVLCP